MEFVIGTFVGVIAIVGGLYWLLARDRVRRSTSERFVRS